MNKQLSDFSLNFFKSYMLVRIRLKYRHKMFIDFRVVFCFLFDFLHIIHCLQVLETGPDVYFVLRRNQFVKLLKKVAIGVEKLLNFFTHCRSVNSVYFSPLLFESFHYTKELFVYSSVVLELMANQQQEISGAVYSLFHFFIRLTIKKQLQTDKIGFSYSFAYRVRGYPF